MQRWKRATSRRSNGRDSFRAPGGRDPVRLPHVWIRALFALGALLSLAVVPASSIGAESRELRGLLRTLPADSLSGPLRRYEAEHSRTDEAADAAYVLGQLLYARGEYRAAAETFSRAAARMAPARKPEARYWAGLSWLALGDGDQARAALDEVARAGSTRHADALLATAQAWEMSGHPARAIGPLEAAVSGDPGEAGPAALERLIALSERTGNDARTRSARERLISRYPRSMEASAARLSVYTPERDDNADRRAGSLSVVIGSFVSLARARSLAGAARSAGFPDARVVSRGEGAAALHTVRLGVFARAAEARKAGEQATQVLGVTYELVREP
jgi:tetratricopeptide (TPR) repeat protein